MERDIFGGTIATLLADACPSIRYRTRCELLGEDSSTLAMKNLLHEVHQQPLVQEALSWQEPDGWFVGNPTLLCRTMRT